MQRTPPYKPSSEYTAYWGMRMRCENPKRKNWKYYGARGIKVCERWRNNPQNFLDDMGPKPSPNHTLGRKDNDGDYTPENCSWETWKQQAASRRKSAHRRKSERKRSHPPEPGRIMKTFVDLIEKFGDAEVAQLLGVDLPHVRVMKNRNSIPPDHWPPLIKFGISYDRLVSMRKIGLRARKTA